MFMMYSEKKNEHKNTVRLTLSEFLMFCNLLDG